MQLYNYLGKAKALENMALFFQEEENQTTAQEQKLPWWPKACNSFQA